MTDRNSPFEIPLATWQVNSLFGDPTLTTPFAGIVVCSVAPLIRQGGRPELTTFATDPGFRPGQHVSAAAWMVAFDVSPEHPQALTYLQEKSVTVLRKGRLYLDEEPGIQGTVTLPGGRVKDLKAADRDSLVVEILLKILRGWAGKWTVRDLRDHAAKGHLAGLPKRTR